MHKWMTWSLGATLSLVQMGHTFAQGLRTPEAGFTPGPEFQRVRLVDQDHGYFLSTSKWAADPSGATIIFVCWQTRGFDNEKKIVRDAIDGFNALSEAEESAF